VEVFHIARKKYSADISGEGARLYGGRWNKKGVGLVYTSKNASLAALEVLAHVSSASFPVDYMLVTITVPDNASIEVLNLNELPSNWRTYPGPQALAELGMEWLLSKRSLLLEVPSALVETEKNLLINPYHPEMGTVMVKEQKRFNFDERLAK